MRGGPKNAPGDANDTINRAGGRMVSGGSGSFQKFVG